MTKISSWVFVAALVLSGTSSALAQSVCPTTPANKISISGVSATDGASYEIYIGNSTSGAQNVTALVKKNGVCQGLKSVTKNGVAFSALPSGTNNVCFGAGIEVVTMLSAPLTFTTCAGSPTLNPFNHNGNTITLYGSGGADRFFGGPGTEIMWGGPGNETLTGSSGINDELYGENDVDQIAGSSGANTYIEGGSGGDTIQDTAGSGDWILGGSGNDLINTGCNVPFAIDCGTNTDTLWHPPHLFGEPAGCETVNHTSGC